MRERFGHKTGRRVFAQCGRGSFGSLGNPGKRDGG